MDRHEQFPNLDRFNALEKERREIVAKLLKFINPDEADRISHEIMDLALSIDSTVKQIAEHPIIKKDYNYDGNRFSRRSGRLHVIPMRDGLIQLKELNNDRTINSYYGVGGSGHLNLIERMKDDKKIAEANLKTAKENGYIGTDIELVKEVFNEAKAQEQRMADEFVRGLKDDEDKDDR